MESLTTALMQVVNSVQGNLMFLGKMLLLLWVLLIINALLGYRLNIFGIYPRRIPGIVGIVFSPFLHGSAGHLFFNSIPFVVLAALILVKGQNYFFQVTIMVGLLSGLLTWFFGRSAFHVGPRPFFRQYPYRFLLIDSPFLLKK